MSLKGELLIIMPGNHKVVSLASLTPRKLLLVISRINTEKD